MRWASKIDNNQPEIVEGLRALGASVCVLSAVGSGCPDLLVAWHGKNALLELKDEEAPLSKQKLTPDQIKWHANWKGQVAVVNSLAGALNALRNLP